MPEGDNWCWDESAFELDVGTEDLEGIFFTQRGYWIDIISSHDTNAYIEQPDAMHIELFIKVSLSATKRVNLTCSATSFHMSDFYLYRQFSFIVLNV